MSATIFIAKYSTDIIEACAGTKIFPSVKMAQAGLETGWGESIVGNNLFGIKATGDKTPYWDGSTVSAWTTEFKNGVSGKYYLTFRKYKSVSDSIRDHTYFLQKYHTRYKSVFEAATPEAQCKALKSSGYATAPDYATILISVINSKKLKLLDNLTAKTTIAAISTISIVALVVGGYFAVKIFKA